MRINPFESANPMTWRDAAMVSLVLMVFQFFTVFMPLWGYPAIMSEPPVFVFQALMFIGGSFMTFFVSLAGLAKYMARE